MQPVIVHFDIFLTPERSKQGRFLLVSFLVPLLDEEPGTKGKRQNFNMRNPNTQFETLQPRHAILKSLIHKVKIS
jgi:hypothetical protein